MGWRQVAIVSPLVIITGTGAHSGLFVYNGTPGTGNLVFWVVAPGVTADPFGNTVQAVLGVGTLGGPGLQIDQFGNLAMAGADGSLLELSPEANLPFALSTLAGVMQTLMTMQTLDGNETQAGVISGLVLGSGATAKMGTLITSPYAGQGMGMLLQAQNDGATDTPFCTWGTVITQGGALTFTPLMALAPQVLILYGGGGAVTVTTKTSGSGTIPSGGAATVKAECWAGGTAGPTGTGGQGGGGSGAAEYAADPALAAGATVAYAVGGPGASSTVTGSAVTVTAHAGTAGTPGGARGTGGTGSANAVHFNGGNGGTGSNGGGGGGGGGSAGPGGAGHAGTNATSGTGANGGTAVSGGAPGGRGGNTGANGSGGSAPGGSGGGGGGGGGGSLGPGAGGGGSQGQVRVTSVGTAPTILASFAAASGTDQYGTAYQAGTQLPGPDSNLYNCGPALKTKGANQTIGTATTAVTWEQGGTVLNLAANITYVFKAIIRAQQNAGAADLDDFQFTVTGTVTYSSIEFKQENIGGAANPWGVTTVNANMSFGPAANTQYVVEIQGTVRLSTAGTFILNAICGTGGGSFTVQQGTFMELTPSVTVN